MPTLNTKLTSHGIELDTDPDKFGELEDSSPLLGSVDELRSRMQKCGHLFLRGFLDKDLVLAARREILEKVASADGLDSRFPLMDGISNGNAKAYDTFSPTEYAASLITGSAYERVCHHPKLLNWFEHFLGGAITPHDYFHLRIMRVGDASGFHYDRVYFYGAPNLYTCWIPLGDVPLDNGPLMLLEGSNHIKELIQDYGAHNIHRQADPRFPGGMLSKNPIELQNRYGGRWLSSNFHAGDVVIFPMFTLHGSMDNSSPHNRLRVSSDSRYQLAAEPIDERMIGKVPFWARPK
jgi:hypothetical protein